MPHIVVEYSANLRTSVDWRLLLISLHKTIADVAKTTAANCKSRVIEQKLFHVGEAENAEERAFVHFNVGILPGRSAEVKQAIGKAVLQGCPLRDCCKILDELTTTQDLEVYLRKVKDAQDVQVTVELRDMEPYFKMQ